MNYVPTCRTRRKNGGSERKSWVYVPVPPGGPSEKSALFHLPSEEESNFDCCQGHTTEKSCHALWPFDGNLMRGPTWLRTSGGQTRKSPARRIGTPIPFPAESGIGDSLFPGQIGNRGFPPRFPAKKSGIGGSDRNSRFPSDVRASTAVDSEYTRPRV